MRAHRARRLRIAFLAVALAACNSSLPVHETTLVDAYMECTECLEHQLDSVLAVGRPAVPLLADYVRNGPPPARMALFHSRSDSVFHEFERYLITHPQPPPFALQNYTAVYAQNYASTYQVRAARALWLLGGADARDALDSALARQLPSDVRTQIQLARDSVRMP